MANNITRCITLSLACSLLAGCPTHSPLAPAAGKVQASSAPGATALVVATSPATGAVTATSAGSLAPAAPGTPMPTLAPTAAAPLAAAGSGLVLGLDGQPAAGVKITAYLIGQDGNGIISQDGNGIVAQGGGNLIGQDGNGYALLSTTQTLQATSGADGRFTLALPAGARANIEAVASDDVKAIALGAADPDGLKLSLDHVGSITGQVLAPVDSTTTNLQGLDVYIPGTSYVAKTDAAGNFTLDHVPVGSFTLVASRSITQTASVTGVAVAAGKATSAPKLQLAIARAAVTTVSPALGAPGTLLTITGKNFGASTGAAFTVTLNGLALTGPVRKDDQTLTVTLPAQATGGDLVVTVDGVAADPIALPVATTFGFANAQRDMFVGDSLKLVPVLADAAGKAIPFTDPTQAAWKADGTTASVDANGLVTAKAEGTTTITAAVGALAGTLQLAVHAGAFITTLTGSAGAATGGGRPAGYADGAAAAALFDHPRGLARGADGTIYVVDRDNQLIRKVAPDGTVSTFAGKFVTTGSSGGIPDFADGAAGDARFSQPEGLCIDAAGNLYVADSANNLIRKVAPDGTVSTFAGARLQAMRYKDGPALSAAFSTPKGLALDAAGNLYVSELDNNAIRKITPDGVVSTVVGAASTQTGNMSRSSGYQDGPADQALLNHPSGLAFDGKGNLLIADANNHCIRMLSGGIVTTVAGLGGTPGLADGNGTTARFDTPDAICFDAQGNLVVADTRNAALRLVSPAGQVTTLITGAEGAGDVTPQLVDGALATARIGSVYGLTLDANGNILLADTYNQRLRRVSRPAP